MNGEEKEEEKISVRGFAYSRMSMRVQPNNASSYARSEGEAHDVVGRRKPWATVPEKD